MIRVGIADDHAVVRAGLRRLLAQEPDLAVCAEAGDGDQALAVACGGGVDVLLLDLAMPGRDGIDVLAGIRRSCPSLPVLVLSGFPAVDYAELVRRQGARGYLNKAAAPSLVAAAIRAVMGGQAWFAPGADTGADARAAHLALSARELQVLLHLARGESVADIAERLEVSIRSVSTWRRHVLNRLHLDTNSDLTHYALKNGLMS
jgi:DNA-binding NarL/FixJ family response regulator